MRHVRIYKTDFGVSIEIGRIRINFARLRYWEFLTPIKVRKLGTSDVIVRNRRRRAALDRLFLDTSLKAPRAPRSRSIAERE